MLKTVYLVNTEQRRAHLDKLGKEVVCDGVPGGRLGLELVQGQGVGHHLNQRRPVAGYQHLIRPQVQRQLGLLCRAALRSVQQAICKGSRGFGSRSKCRQ